MNELFLARWKRIEQLRLALPLRARAEPPLIERLQKSRCREAARSNLLVTNVFDGGRDLGLMCELDLTQYSPCAPLLVAPLAHRALDRRYGRGQKPQRHRRRAAPQAS